MKHLEHLLINWKGRKEGRSHRIIRTRNFTIITLTVFIYGYTIYKYREGELKFLRKIFALPIILFISPAPLFSAGFCGFILNKRKTFFFFDILEQSFIEKFFFLPLWNGGWEERGEKIKQKTKKQIICCFKYNTKAKEYSEEESGT